MLTKSKAIVIKSIKYGEQKLVVDFYTSSFGRMTSVVKISEKKGGKFRKQYFQPLTILTVEAEYREQSAMQRISDVQIAAPCPSLHSDPVKMTIGLFLAEILYHVTRQESDDEGLFAFLEHSILWLDATESGIANFHIAFLVRLVGLLGFLPSHHEYHEGEAFDMMTGEFTSSLPLHTHVLRGDEAHAMSNVLRMNYTNMHLFRMSRQQRNRCIEMILLFCRLHLPAFPEIKSFAVFQEFFRNV